MSGELFKPPDEQPAVEGQAPVLETKPPLPIHQVCCVCQTELARHLWSKPGEPGLCDPCARGHQTRR